MPLLLALGLVASAASVYYAKKTIDAGEMHPQVWGYDARNVGIVGGLVAAGLGAVVGIPLLAAVGLGVATGAYTNRDLTARVERGLRQMIRSEIDQGLSARQIPPPPADDVPPPLVLPDEQLDNLNEPGTRPPRPSSVPAPNEVSSAMLRALDFAA